MNVPDCLLCRAERLTEWFHEDDTCWIAECTVCATPMVVWKPHSARPPADVRDRMHALLAEVVAGHFDYVHYVDEHMRQIPDHYHAHARPVGGFFGGPHLRRRP